MLSNGVQDYGSKCFVCLIRDPICTYNDREETHAKKRLHVELYICLFISFKSQMPFPPHFFLFLVLKGFVGCVVK